jgi:aspartate aminotransferase
MAISGGGPLIACHYRGGVERGANRLASERLSRRVSAISPSATLAVDAQARALSAAGERVISFGAGEPDFATPQHIVEAAVAAARDPATHHYTATAGIPRLREAIAAKTLRDSGYEISPAQVVVTNGGKQAYYETIEALVNPGDEIIIPAPYWTTYPEPVVLAGGHPVVIPTDEASGFRVTVEQLELARNEQTKALLFVSPSNPSGAVYPPDEVEAIGRWALEHGIWIITDEIYEHLTYDDHVHTPMLSVVPEAAEQTVVLNGVAKTYAMTGWRVGWMIGPADLVAAASTLQSHLCSNVANVSQWATVAALEGGLDDVARMREAFDRRRLTIHRMLNEIPGISCMRPQGAFYAFPDLTGVLDADISTTTLLAEVALTKAHVAFVPGEAFGAPGYARFSYALSDADLEEGISRLADAIGR